MLAFLGRRLRWYQFVIAAISLTIVYPDVVAQWIAERRSISFTNRLVALVFTGGIACLFLFTAVAHSMDERIRSWEALLAIGMFALVRVILAFVKMLLGLDRDP